MKLNRSNWFSGSNAFLLDAGKTKHYIDICHFYLFDRYHSIHPFYVVKGRGEFQQ